MQTPKKIGILIVPLDKRDDTRALRYLVLHQNTLQSSFEFEILPCPTKGIVELLPWSGPVIRETVENEMPKLINSYRASLSAQAKKYGRPQSTDIPIVVFSAATFSDNWYATGGEDWAVIAIGNWKRHMAPPSLFEFFLSRLIRASIIFACPNARNLRHLATKGCCFDFTPQIADARYSVFSGFICSDCRKEITDCHSEQLVADAKLLLGKNWLGTVSKPEDASITAKKLGYDLYHTKGLTPTIYERLKSFLETETPRLITQIVSSVIVAGIIFYAGWRSGR